MKRYARTVAIIGAGFSGTMLAINLARHGGPRTILIERRPERIARGLAYGTPQPAHLLNVRASNMSAYPDDPDHFRRWLGDSDSEKGNRFVSRMVYGSYLNALLEQAVSDHPERLTVIHGQAEDLERDGKALRVRLSDGTTVSADHLVLAAGNLPPHPISQLSDLGDGIYQPDPWGEGTADNLGPDDEVLLFGTGLTAIDTIFSLRAAGFEGRITALSRRGLVPQAHAESGPLVTARDRPAANGSWLIRAVRQRAAAAGWRTAVDELRQHTQDLWRRVGPEGQRRFLRHLRPYWDIHRHRLAPDVAGAIARWRSSGDVRFVAGKLLSATSENGKALVRWRVRGTDTVCGSAFARIINCTGPQGDLRTTPDPLLRALTARGLIRPDPLYLGIDVRADGAVRDRDGKASPVLSAVGPMTRGEAWEIIAVPDIRRQVNELARRLAGVHWVGGEGL